MTIKELTAAHQALSDKHTLLERQLKAARLKAEELTDELKTMSDTNPDLDALTDDCDEALDTVSRLHDQLTLADNAERAVSSAISALQLAKAWGVWEEKEG